MLLYRLDLQERGISVRIEEQGTRRILYLDTVQSLAKEQDKAALSFLTKIHLRSPNASRGADTISFQKIDLSIEQSLDALKLLSLTGRLYYKNTSLQSDWKNIAKIYWRGEAKGAFFAVLQWKGIEIPLEECDRIFPSWCLWKGSIFPIAIDVPWKWVELFAHGPICLQGAQRKKFLEENPPILWKEIAPEKPLEVLPQLVLTDVTGCFANLWMNYSDIGSVAFQDLSPTVNHKVRFKKKEEDWERDLLEAGYQKKIVGNSCYYCMGDKVKETLHFLLDLGWTLLDSRGKKIARQTQCSFDVREELGLIAIRGQVHFQEKQISLKSAMQSKGMWVELDEGSVGLIDRASFAPLEGEWIEDKILVKKASLGSLIPLFEQGKSQWEEKVWQMAQGLKIGGGCEELLPGSSFQGTLLPYQQKGLSWLGFLQKWGFGALLADEMGLGKTVQILALFSRQRTNLPILVVAPSSLLYQWRSEIRRFLKESEVYIHTGPDRKKDIFKMQGIVITSYAMIRLDEEIFAKQCFEIIVLDESNAIKTASTHTAKSAYRLKGNFRIALTGTPIENRAEELQSQFRFLMPDLQIQGIEALKGKTKPFILRRKKIDVEIELPEKIEQIAWVEMTEKQEELYHSYLSHFQGNLLKKMEKDGIASHRMEILEAILRLRQICVDPRLVGGEGIGSKLELLRQEIEGKKVLIYSQFTSMLQLVGNALKEDGRDFLYLDGSVSSEKRSDLVMQFQNDPNPSIFLLSLKAGGVGLNLTSADYILLLDPWWNDAVEQQAIGRAHRIGQKKTVIIKRYLVPNSIEEKMLHLKENKKGVAELLLDDDEVSWTGEDLLHLLS